MQKESNTNQLLPDLPEEPEFVSDQRSHDRTVVKLAVTLSSESNFYTGITRDIGEGGLFVATMRELPRTGTILDLQFSLPDGGPPISVSGIVRWLREESTDIEEPPGFGVQFVELSPSAEARLNLFIEQQRDSTYFEM